MPVTPDSKHMIEAQVDLRRHQAELMELKKEFQDFMKSDKELHDSINSSVRHTGTVLASYTIAGKIIWGVAGLFVVGLGSLMGWEASRVSSLQDEISDMKIIVAESTTRDMALQERMKEVKDEMRELRRRLSRDERKSKGSYHD